MISEEQVQQVYREDQRYPYYSLQGGRRARRLEREQRRRQWIWGHFRHELERALANPQSKAA
jgi:hypothetical protein